ncbi:MAG: RusA family crossover junction endodeoxyribonuclease [Aquificae bacterium]|nr:RusA family crossover junction endodeoxyribonuclease [Aquificota bacterium]
MKKSFQNEKKNRKNESIFFLSFIPPSKANRVKINTKIFSKSGKRYIVPKDVSLKINKAIWELQKQNEKKNLFYKEAVSVEIFFILPNKRRRDLDNIMKTLGDCLVYAGILEDDNLIFKQTLEKFIIKGREGVVIKIKNYQERKLDKKLLEKLEKYKGFIDGDKL